MSRIGAAPRAAVPVSNARAEASRTNGAKSRGPKTPEGKSRSAQNALKHGLRAQKYVVLPQEDAAEFAALETVMLAQLAPVGALQTLLARRVAVAAWRLERADRLEAEVFEERGYGAVGPGVALIRDGNGTRSVETLLRYRGAAMAEFMRSLRMLKALQAEQAATPMDASAPHPEIARRPKPKEPERLMDDALPGPPTPGRTLHEPAVRWVPNGPETGRRVAAAPSLPQPEPNKPDGRSSLRPSGQAGDRAKPSSGSRGRDPEPTDVRPWPPVKSGAPALEGAARDRQR